MFSFFILAAFSGFVVPSHSCGLPKIINSANDLIALMPASTNILGTFQNASSSDFFLLSFRDQVQYMGVNIYVDMLDEMSNPITDCNNLNVNYDTLCIPQISIPENCYASKSSSTPTGPTNIKFNLKYIIKGGGFKVSQIMRQVIIIQLAKEFTTTNNVETENAFKAEELKTHSMSNGAMSYKSTLNCLFFVSFFLFF